MLSTKKVNGRVYTPNYIVLNILDLCDYSGIGILGKHIIDNSCGDGAFLVEVVRRYCEIAQSHNVSDSQITLDLGKFIHGIEIDFDECQKCRQNLSEVADCFGIKSVNWDVNCADTLTVKKYDGKMDFVVGNPPYVRVHNLLDNYTDVKQFSFAQNGMTDLYIVFYEIGLNMLNSTGTLGYISPSSLFNSVAAATMRKNIICNNNLKKVVDLKHFQPFEATTYTTIMILTKEANPFIDYYEYDQNNFEPFVVSRLNYENFVMNDSFVFGQKDVLERLQEMVLYAKCSTAYIVKNGFATLYDDFFIGNWDFDDYTIPIIKASTGVVKKCIFPYDSFGNLVPFDGLIKIPTIREHYYAHIDRLKKRSLEKDSHWYAFGRSQGINDVYKRKYAINTLIRDVNDIKLQVAASGTGVYSGLYILTDLGFDELQQTLFSDDFVSYVSILGKYKSGGYYTYSSKDLSRYLNYKFVERSGYNYGQFAIS